jgi:branched-chain amino acid transport system permease protein
MTDLKLIVINGLINGGVYAVLAVGFSLIFGVARILNLAHTAFYMLAAYLIFYFSISLGLDLYFSVFLSIVAVTIAGIFSYRLVIDRVRQHETTVLIVTIALAIIIQESLLTAFGAQPPGIESMVSGYTKIMGVRVLYQQILVFGAAIVILLAAWALLTKTKLGIAIRSIAQDMEVANLMGINVARMGMITMAIAVALAAIAGALVAPITFLRHEMWMHPLVMVLAIVVLGGLGSIKGSMLGAFILAFAEAIVTVFWPSQAFLAGAVALAIMLAVIVIRPQGLFGVSFEEER